MDSLYAQNIPNELEDIPRTNEPVWILGKRYDAMKELEIIRRDIRSKLWFTYRKGFISISGSHTAVTTDKGWGCMLRCGQMVLGQALILLHLGRDWVWTPGKRDNKYLEILKCFEDRQSAPFSIHQIALTGETEKKMVGQWFGPNTIAQVLKKLVSDRGASITMHVALDNTVIVNDILRQCRVEGGVTVEVGDKEPLKAPCQWKPLLLLIPLRLGLNEINPVYINGLKASFKIPQSLGVIGGKPNLALYFIGCVGNELIYLDPHTTQRSGFIQESKDGEKEKENIEMDNTYHCKSASRISFMDIDPSVALCFFCVTEEDFKSLCRSIQDLIALETHPLFELSAESLVDWSLAEDAVSDAIAISSSIDFDDISDEDFELLG